MEQLQAFLAGASPTKLAMIGAVVVAAIVVLKMLTSEKDAAPDHMQKRKCGKCGFMGSVSKFNPKCSKCGNPF